MNACAALTLVTLSLAPAQPAPRAPAQPLALAPAQQSEQEPRVPGGDRSALEAVTEEQARAVEKGLQWLAERQEPSGCWNADVGFKLNEGYSVTGRDKGHLGVTALAGMAFLAGGNLPGRGKYGGAVEKALDYVLSCVSEDGYIFVNGSRMYDHAFATLFLAEICGMTHREDVQKSLQKAIDFIVRSQNKEGGWRYEPYARESDMSIVVCQVVALRAARNIGIRVPKNTVDLAARYVMDSAVTQEMGVRYGSMYSNDPGTFCYQRDRNSRTSFALTAAGVTALHGLGIYSDELIKKGLNYLAAELDRFDSYPSSRSGHYYFWYGHYYGVQAMYTAGSPYWEPYFDNLRRVLLGMQRSDGSWPNETGPGPVFGTAMAVLILEIPYRFLPIFQR